MDSEAALGNAIERNLPGVICWNHVLNAVKRWLREHLKGTLPESPKFLEISVYVTHLKNLFHQPDEESYKSKLDELKGYWSMPFCEYYSQHIDPQVRMFVFVYDTLHMHGVVICYFTLIIFTINICHLVLFQVTASLGRWILEPLGIYSAFSGVTSNQSESFNAVLKDFEKWKEAPIDSAMLSFYYLQVYYYNEIQRGLCGIGTYMLLPKFLSLKCEIDELKVLKSSTTCFDTGKYSIQNIVK